MIGKKVVATNHFFSDHFLLQAGTSMQKSVAHIKSLLLLELSDFSSFQEIAKTALSMVTFTKL